MVDLQASRTCTGVKKTSLNFAAAETMVTISEIGRLGYVPFRMLEMAIRMQ
jgi:hypothetical protein